MKLARVVGNATLSRMNSAMAAASLRCVEVVPSADAIEDLSPGRQCDGDLIVAWDICGCCVGDLVALAEGPEAAAPFKPDVKPIDASIVAILDRYEIHSRK